MLTQLTSLSIQHGLVGASCLTCQAADFQALSSLQGLQALDIYSLQLPLVAGGRDLVACSSLRSMTLRLAPCSCCTSPTTSLASLSCLTGLTRLELYRGDIPEYIQLHRLPGLRMLELACTFPFVQWCRTERLPLPTFDVALLKLSFLYTEDWTVVQDVVADFCTAHRRARRHGFDSFARLQLDSWPDDFCPAAVEAAITHDLTALALHGVQIESDVAWCEDGHRAESFGLS